MNSKIKRLFVNIGILLLFLVIPKYVSADNEATMKEGIVTYKATDTTASYDTTWRTEGFTVKNKPTGGDPTNPPKGKFMLSDGEKASVVDGKITTTTFTFPETKVEKEFNKADISAQSLKDNGGLVYLNGILRVYYKNKPKGSYKYTLQGIKDAEGWTNPHDFDDRFDIELPYSARKVPVYMTIMRYSKNGYVTDKEETKKIGYFMKRTFYSTTTDSIKATYESPVTKKELYLFQTHWAYRNVAETYHSNGTYRTMHDKIKTSINAKTDWEGYKKSLQAIRNRQYEVKSDEGIEIVCVYKNMEDPIPPPPPDDLTGINEFSRDIVTPYTSCVIQSNIRGHEIYNSEEAIPSSEYQYVNVKTSEYLLQYKFRQVFGVKYYKQKMGTKLVDMPRNYSYWKIIDLNVYALTSTTVENRSLPNGSITLTPSSSCYKAPYVSYNIYDSNIIEPLDTIGTTNVGQIKARSDSLYFNGQLLMSGEWCEGNAKAPETVPVASTIADDTFYTYQLKIDPLKANGECDSASTVKYTRICHVGDDSEGDTIELDVDNINNVVIHTPTVCDALIEDKKAYNQMIEPDKSCPSLVLDTFFDVKLPTEGTHDMSLKGYKTKDYAKYIKQREIKFPFDVYRSTTDYIKAGTWITVTNDITKFYLPTWVEEGDYTIDFRSRTINCDANNGLDQTEELANLDYENYVATDTLDVQVSGRLFGFNVYDISDYPIWQKVFRQLGTLYFTNFNYTTGTKDRNGNAAYDYFGKLRDAKYTLPIVNGSHPAFGNIGAIKTGYYNRFSVRTMGTFDGINDYIHITPKFYFVNPDGSGRQEVDLYYTEYFQSDKKKHIMVKVGSNLDKKNTHLIDRDDPYLGVRGGTPVIKEPRSSWTFGDIKINGSLMLLSGNHQFTPQVKTTDMTLLEKQKKSVQTWFCEYYLPATIHACPKGYNVDQYALDHNGLDFSESFWLKKGYIIINFEIEAVKDGERYLSYINKENVLKGGYCNMWELEGGVLTKLDEGRYPFTFKYGDYVMYYADPNKSVTSDYRSGGIY